MELFRIAARTTRICFPMVATNGVSLSGASLVGRWMAWDDTDTGPYDTPGMMNLVDDGHEIAATGIYTCQLVASELPVASPYVMLSFTGSGAFLDAATQYILIRTASVYADVQAISNDSTAADNLEADYDGTGYAKSNSTIGTTTNLTNANPTAATIADAVWDEDIVAAHGANSAAGLSQRRMYFASPFSEQTIGTASNLTTNNDKTGYRLSVAGVDDIFDEVVTTGHTTDNTFGLAARTMYFASDYLNTNLDAQMSTRLAPTVSGRTLDVDAAGGCEVGSIQTGAIAAASFTAGAIDAAAIAADAIGASEIAANAIGSSELAQSAAQEIADEVLNRNLAGGGSGNTRNVRNALRVLRNRVALAVGDLTVYQEDDLTSAWTAEVTTTATDPITEINPA